MELNSEEILAKMSQDVQKAIEVALKDYKIENDRLRKENAYLRMKMRKSNTNAISEDLKDKTIDMIQETIEDLDRIKEYLSRIIQDKYWMLAGEICDEIPNTHKPSGFGVEPTDLRIQTTPMSDSTYDYRRMAPIRQRKSVSEDEGVPFPRRDLGDERYK